MISLINYRSNLEEINTSASLIINILTKHHFTNDHYLSEIIDKLLQQNNKMTETLKEEVVRSTLAPLDNQRDKSARAIFLEIKAKLLWPDENIVNAAETIMEILDKYGMEVLNMSYGSESKYLNTLLEDFKKPHIIAAINILPGFYTLIEQLEKDQIIFEEAYHDYISKRTKQRNMLSASKIGEVVRKIVNNELIKYIDVMSEVKPQIYKHCADEVETVIRDNNFKVKARVSKLKEEALKKEQEL